MKIKVVVGGLDTPTQDLIKELGSESGHEIEVVSLGTKVTRVALMRHLKDPTVSTVFLGKTDYDNVTRRLDDTRLFCVGHEDDIYTLFEQKYGVSTKGIIEDLTNSPNMEEIDNEADLGITLPFGEDNEDLELDGVGDEDLTDTPSPSISIDHEQQIDSNLDDWETMLQGFNEIMQDTDTNDGVDDLEEDQDEETEYELVDDSEDINEEDSDEDTESTLSLVIDNLREQIKELEEENLNSISLLEYQKVKDELQGVSDKLAEVTSSNQQETTKRIELESKMLEIQTKFSEMLNMYKEQGKVVQQLKATKKQQMGKLKRRYSNVEIITPLSSNSVFEYYRYISTLEGNVVFIDLTNNTYIDQFLSLQRVIKPTKWLLEGVSYKDVGSSTLNKPNIYAITSAIHILDRSNLLKTDWDRVLSEMVEERRVIINFGFVGEEGVVELLNAFKDSVSIRGFTGKLQSDSKISKMYKDQTGITEVYGLEGSKDRFGVITKFV